MEGIILLVSLLLLFVLLGLTVEEISGPVQLVLVSAIVVMTGWYLLF